MAKASPFSCLLLLRDVMLVLLLLLLVELRRSLEPVVRSAEPEPDSQLAEDVCDDLVDTVRHREGFLLLPVFAMFLLLRFWT
ncbi:hypothetical protein BCR34DRAFT_565363 [Clohesyomyces aquaticus]|uniref:Uncharacterized protein n=1 Tax=Clohesyomyces aquaticus TaxID=1231657 RepID=A0A1Y1ZNP9_9PLEO|nr:hypothetical protein BCR34DRAFT_565363 [Clohesyomyces aquaticus]